MLTSVDIGNCFHNSISLYLFCGIDFVFSGIAKGKPKKTNVSFHFCYKAAGEPISNRIWTHGESTQDPKHERTID